MKSNDTLIAADAAARIRSMLLGGELKPGQRLVEEDLVRLLGLGRTPVREALLLLQGEGFVNRTHRGWEARGAGSVPLAAVAEVRAALEGACARLAAGRLDPEVLAQLEELIVQMEPAAHVNRLKIDVLNQAFHLILVRAAGNELLATFLARATYHFNAARAGASFSNEELKAANAGHRALLDALRRGAADEAEGLARAHVEATARVIETYLEAAQRYETIARIAALESGQRGGAGNTTGFP